MSQLVTLAVNYCNREQLAVAFVVSVDAVSQQRLGKRSFAVTMLLHPRAIYVVRLIVNHCTTDIIPTSSKRKQRIILYDLVTRYGPQSVASAKLCSISRFLYSSLSPERRNERELDGDAIARLRESGLIHEPLVRQWKKDGSSGRLVELEVNGDAESGGVDRDGDMASGNARYSCHEQSQRLQIQQILYYVQLRLITEQNWTEFISKRSCREVPDAMAFSYLRDLRLTLRSRVGIWNVSLRFSKIIVLKLSSVDLRSYELNELSEAMSLNFFFLLMRLGKLGDRKRSKLRVLHCGFNKPLYITAIPSRAINYEQKAGEFTNLGLKDEPQRNALTSEADAKASFQLVLVSHARSLSTRQRHSYSRSTPRPLTNHVTQINQSLIFAASALHLEVRFSGLPPLKPLSVIINPLHISKVIIDGTTNRWYSQVKLKSLSISHIRIKNKDLDRRKESIEHWQSNMRTVKSLHRDGSNAFINEATLVAALKYRLEIIYLRTTVLIQLVEKTVENLRQSELHALSGTSQNVVRHYEIWPRINQKWHISVAKMTQAQELFLSLFFFINGQTECDFCKTEDGETKGQKLAAAFVE
ncbi:hypothetical protein WN51_11203 [Melipona quadrifasciata]|uniref:Uncharacterized protein n=1 Tax=Melipona quadrifasciata TaxID=166423 RepID=A0A0M9A6D6_9HYME|nr:hypothetical protein WN51_11203 [Melipona quadrifasciata]